MGLFRSYAKFKMGQKVFRWVMRKVRGGSSSRGRGRVGAGRR